MVDAVNSITSAQTERQKVFDYVRTLLGDGMVDVELDPNHYEIALDRAIDKYRQRSENAVEESYGFLELQPNQNVYTLPDEVVSVRQIFRRTVGGASSSEGGTALDPFELAYTNVYLLQTGRLGGLATYDAFAGYQELVGRMFGGFINFHYQEVNRRLEIVRRVRSAETVLLWLYNHKPDETLLKDVYAKPWIRDYTLAGAKFMLGEARSKFATVAGPQGGTALNGDQLKAEATAEMTELDRQLEMFTEGSQPMSFVIG